MQYNISGQEKTNRLAFTAGSSAADLLVRSFNDGRLLMIPGDGFFPGLFFQRLPIF
jgi:hypothetical protein